MVGFEYPGSGEHAVFAETDATTAAVASDHTAVASARIWFDAYDGWWYFNPEPVPEPATLALAALGGALVLVRRR